jgi:hypothetical protein
LRSVILTVCWFAIGCSDAPSSPPPLHFAGRESACSEATEPCLNADTTTFEVAGLRVVHKRIVGEPIITASVLFDRSSDFSDPVTAHAQYLAMRLISWWGSQKYIRDWDEQLGRLGATHWSTCATDYAHTGVTVPAVNFAAAWHMLASALVAHRSPRFPAMNSRA